MLSLSYFIWFKFYRTSLCIMKLLNFYLSYIFFVLSFLSLSSLDSEFLASTSTDGSARIWKTDDGVPLTTLARKTVWLSGTLVQQFGAIFLASVTSFEFFHFVSCRMKRLSYVVFLRMEQNHFCFALLSKVSFSPHNFIIHYFPYVCCSFLHTGSWCMLLSYEQIIELLLLFGTLVHGTELGIRDCLQRLLP